MSYQEVRAQFGVVTQGASIFIGIIRENITLNNPTMPMEQVIGAAQVAAIHEDILQMPMEYGTFVSERGSALSGGQRQRQTLARAGEESCDSAAGRGHERAGCGDRIGRRTQSEYAGLYPDHHRPLLERDL